MQKRGAKAVVACGIVLGLSGLVACGGGAKSGESAGNSAPATKAAAPATAGGGEAQFGVPECDEYIAKYTACVDSKVPEAARVMVRQQLEATRVSWKQAASTPEGRAGLTLGCKQASEAAKAAMQAYGCSW